MRYLVSAIVLSSIMMFSVVAYSADFINVKDFGAKGDGLSDDSKSIQAAINYASANEIKKVYIPYAIYAIHTQLSIELGVTVYSDGAVLNFEKCQDSSAIIIYPQNVNHIPVSFLNVDKLVLDNLYLLGNEHAIFSKPVMYKKMVALEFKAAGIGISNCLIAGFEKGTVFKSNAYLISFRNCSFYYNDIGFSFDYSTYTNLGERISLTNCNIANNNYGIYNNKGYVFLINCSIDYNNILQIKDNVTEVGGQTRSALIINNSHIEKEGLDSSGPTIVNHGYLSIVNSIFDFTGETHTPLIKNDGDIFLQGNSFVGNNDNYLIDGNLPSYCQGNNYIDPYNIQAIHPAFAIINGDFETGISGWRPVNGTIINQISNESHSGNKCLKVQSWTYGTGMVQTTVKVRPGRQLALIYWINFQHDAPGVNYANLHYYDSTYHEISSFSQQMISTAGVDKFMRNTIPWNVIPKNAEYAVIELQTTGKGGRYFALFDDVYLAMRGEHD